MVDKKQIFKEIEEKYEKAKKEVGFETSLEDLDFAFSIKDGILSNRFVSDNFLRQVCSKIIDYYGNWINYLNGLLVSNPSFIPLQTEAKLFNSETDKKLIWSLVKKAMAFSSLNALINLKSDKSFEKEFIDGSYKYWKETFSPSLTKIFQRIYEAWKKD